MKIRGWKETEATVYSCGWQDEHTRLNAGLPGGSYLIIFNYEIDGHWYSGEFLNGSAIAEGARFSLRYDPNDPERNEKTVESQLSSWIAYSITACAVAGFVLYKWLTH